MLTRYFKDTIKEFDLWMFLNKFDDKDAIKFESISCLIAAAKLMERNSFELRNIERVGEVVFTANHSSLTAMVKDLDDWVKSYKTVSEGFMYKGTPFTGSAFTWLTVRGVDLDSNLQSLSECLKSFVILHGENHDEITGRRIEQQLRPITRDIVELLRLCQTDLKNFKGVI